MNIKLKFTVTMQNIVRVNLFCLFEPSAHDSPRASRKLLVDNNPLLHISQISGLRKLQQQFLWAMKSIGEFLVANFANFDALVNSKWNIDRNSGRN